MNTKTKGDISSAIIFAELVKHGYTVLTPWGDKNRYDLVVEEKGKFYRIQCKTACINNDCVEFRTCSITTKNGKPVRTSYSADDVDLFMVYSPETKKVYILKQSDVPKVICFLRLTEPKNGQRNGIRMAVDFEFIGKI